MEPGDKNIYMNNEVNLLKQFKLLERFSSKKNPYFFRSKNYRDKKGGRHLVD